MSIVVNLLTLATISICGSPGLAQNTNPLPDQKDPTMQSATAGKRISEESPNPPAVIFVKADRERIYALLAEEMKKQDFSFVKKDAGTIIFSKRTPGAEAATRRKQFDRRLNTPIVDDPRAILAFIVIEKSTGCVVGARMIVTTIVNSQVFSLDVSQRKQAKIGLNRILEKLKLDADTP